MSGFGVRVVSGAVLLVLVLAAIWVRGPLLLVLVGVAAVLAAHEFFSMVRRAGYQPWYPAGVALALLLALRGYLGAREIGEAAYPDPGTGAELLGVALVLLLAIARQGFMWSQAAGVAHMRAEGGGTGVTRSPYLAWADLGLTLGGALYTGGLLGYAPVLGALPEGAGTASGSAWLLMVLLGTAACDTGAYLVGSAIGSQKLIPHISPGKTWEGLAGGVLGAVVAAVALSGLLQLDLGRAVVLGLVVCTAAVLGDLCESMIKRATGVKDSGTIIPGHGGLLDRMDSVLFVLLGVYWFVNVFVMRNA